MFLGISRPCSSSESKQRHLKPSTSSKVYELSKLSTSLSVGQGSPINVKPWTELGWKGVAYDACLGFEDLLPEDLGFAGISTKNTVLHCLAVLPFSHSSSHFECQAIGPAFPYSQCRDLRFQPPVTINADVEVSTENVLATTFCSTWSIVIAGTAPSESSP